jgi:hypothetical protein
MTKHNELYEAPAIEVVELKYEGVICASGNANATMEGTFDEIDI